MKAIAQIFLVLEKDVLRLKFQEQNFHGKLILTSVAFFDVIMFRLAKAIPNFNFQKSFLLDTIIFKIKKKKKFNTFDTENSVEITYQGMRKNFVCKKMHDLQFYLVFNLL